MTTEELLTKCIAEYPDVDWTVRDDGAVIGTPSNVCVAVTWCDGPEHRGLWAVIAGVGTARGVPTVREVVDEYLATVAGLEARMRRLGKRGSMTAEASELSSSLGGDA